MKWVFKKYINTVYSATVKVNKSISVTSHPKYTMDNGHIGKACQLGWDVSYNIVVRNERCISRKLIRIG